MKDRPRPISAAKERGLAAQSCRLGADDVGGLIAAQPAQTAAPFEELRAGQIEWRCHLRQGDPPQRLVALEEGVPLVAHLTLPELIGQGGFDGRSTDALHRLMHALDGS